MIRIKEFISCIALLLFCLSGKAQEKIMPLHSNPAIKAYLNEHRQPISSISSRSTQSISDTLPFIDDFSYDGIYPNPYLWSDSDVFINRDFPINPPTLGVATFDGLNKYGNPYSPYAQIDSIADHLTSNYINLDYPGDSSVWLSFFYEPQGNSYYPPNPGDSLMVEFENPYNSDTGTVRIFNKTVTLTSGDPFVTDGTWNGLFITINSEAYQIASVTSATSLILSTNEGVDSNLTYSIVFSTWNVVWSTPGIGGVADTTANENAVFKQVMINIRDTAIDYLNGNFRFRFTNIANLNGAVSQWNVDYVRLDTNRTASDTAIGHDGAFLYRNPSFLAPPYTSIPYSHYETNPSLYTSTSDTIEYKDLWSDSVILTKEFRLYIADTIYDFIPYSALLGNVPAYSTVKYANQFPPSFALPITSAPSLTFSTWNINTTHDNLPQNDTVRETQTLSNYYSYDDGTAEEAYGVWPASGLGNAAVAEKFNVIKQDTLTGVYFYWDQIPSITNTHFLLINVAVWDQLTPGTNNQHLLYQIVDTVPANDSIINGFYPYVFDTLLIVKGTIYVGWIQEFEQNFMNVGFDVNTNSDSLLFFNPGYQTPGSQWFKSSLPGSAMIRPFFGTTFPLFPTAVNEVTKANFSASVFPNPAYDVINVSVNAKPPSSYSYQLFDAVGKLIREQKQTTLDVSSLENGFYILKITDDKTSQFITKKVLINH